MNALIFSPYVLEHCKPGDEAWTLAWNAHIPTFVLLDVRELSQDDILNYEVQFSLQLRNKLGLTDVRIVRVTQTLSPVSVCRGIGYDVSECSFVVSANYREPFMEPLLHCTTVRRV